MGPLHAQLLRRRVATHLKTTHGQPVVTDTRFAPSTGFLSTLSPSRPRPIHSAMRVLVTDAIDLCRSRGWLPSEARPASVALSAQDPLRTSEPVMAQGANAASCQIVVRRAVTNTRFARLHGLSVGPVPLLHCLKCSGRSNSPKGDDRHL